MSVAQGEYVADRLFEALKVAAGDLVANFDAESESMKAIVATAATETIAAMLSTDAKHEEHVKNLEHLAAQIKIKAAELAMKAEHGARDAVLRTMTGLLFSAFQGLGAGPLTRLVSAVR